MRWLPTLLLLPLLITAGCAAIRVALWPPFQPEDIPNFARVDDGIYRGGQPTKAGWKKLRKLGVSKVVKLNLEAEGSDDASKMIIHRYPIDIDHQINPLSPVPIILIQRAVADITPGTYVHCGSDSRTRSWLDKKLNVQGGQDRTGLIIACYRVSHGWDKESAERERDAFGFHKYEMLGLDKAWEEFTENK